MKKLNLLIGLLMGITILSCSSDDNDSEDLYDPIVGEWNEVRTVEIVNGQTFTFDADNCELMNTETFNSNQTYEFKFYDDESGNCELSLESISGNWSKTGDFYDINSIFRNVNSGEEFNSNETIEYETRDIFIENDTLKIRYNFTNETTIVEYTK
jgi:hypothetical protein